MTLPPSAGPFAVGDRVNARLRQMEVARGEAPLWYSAVVERKRGNKYDVVFDDEDVLWGLTDLQVVLAFGRHFALSSKQNSEGCVYCR